MQIKMQGIFLKKKTTLVENCILHFLVNRKTLFSILKNNYENSFLNSIAKNMSQKYTNNCRFSCLLLHILLLQSRKRFPFFLLFSSSSVGRRRSKWRDARKKRNSSKGDISLLFSGIIRSFHQIKVVRGRDASLNLKSGRRAERDSTIVCLKKPNYFYI